ncbi:hypothetical protein ACTXT7_008595 [Hymenolepis weldensis]
MWDRGDEREAKEPVIDKRVCTSNLIEPMNYVFKRNVTTRSRPLSDAMLSNHYYDKSELLSPDMIPGLDGAPEAPFDPQFHDPDSRPTSVGVYSNDEEEVDEDEDSSLYEAVDRRARKVGTLPPAPHPPPPPQISTPQQHNANTIEMVSHSQATEMRTARDSRAQSDINDIEEALRLPPPPTPPLRP